MSKSYAYEHINEIIDFSFKLVAVITCYSAKLCK